jgi:hypothetical protein
LAGDKVEWRGRREDPRYRLKASTIVANLSIAEAEMRSAGLRVLVTKDIARERAAERRHDHRRRCGVVLRAEYEWAATTRHDEAARLRSTGLSWRDVASTLGLPSADAARMSASRARPTPKTNGSETVYGGVAQRSSSIANPPASVLRPDPQAVSSLPADTGKCPMNVRVLEPSGGGRRDQAPRDDRCTSPPIISRQRANSPRRGARQERDQSRMTGAMGKVGGGGPTLVGTDPRYHDAQGLDQTARTGLVDPGLSAGTRHSLVGKLVSGPHGTSPNG